MTERSGTGEEGYERRGTGVEGFGRRGNGEEGYQKPTATDRKAAACQRQRQRQCHLLHHTSQTTHHKPHTRTLSPPLTLIALGCVKTNLSKAVCVKQLLCLLCLLAPC